MYRVTQIHCCYDFLLAGLNSLVDKKYLLPLIFQRFYTLSVLSLFPSVISYYESSESIKAVNASYIYFFLGIELNRMFTICLIKMHGMYAVWKVMNVTII